jgi:hypothetical protein
MIREFRKPSTSFEIWIQVPDTIPLALNWQKVKYALILVDDFTRQCFVKLLKDLTQFHVAEALDEHFSQQKPLSTGVKGVNFMFEILCFGLIEDLNSSMQQFSMSVGATVEPRIWLMHIAFYKPLISLICFHPQQIQRIHCLMSSDSRRIYCTITQLPLWSSDTRSVRFVQCIWMMIILTGRDQMCVLLHLSTFVEQIIVIAKAISSGSTVRMQKDVN